MKIGQFKLVALFVFSLQALCAQNEDKVLMTVDNDSIYVSEFLRVYNKNLDLVKDETQKDIEGYLKLFTEYQLKLKEAKRLKLDEDSKYKREFNQYKKQLTQNYLSENKVTDALIKEAYDRMKFDVNASHILVRLDESLKGNDTISAYKQVLELRERALKEGYEAVQSQMHNGKTIFLEDLGYFSTFEMVYEFESEAYKTPPGEISMPFRTRFGYHVVYVKDKRPSKGTITAAHIMIANEQKDSTINPETRINEIYAKLRQGESFEALAKQFSEDKSSANNGGQLKAFKSGQLSAEEFEDMAFSLQKDGDVSQPFQTAFGWHVVKRLNLKTLEPFDQLKTNIESKVKRDTRSKLINSAMVEELKKRYTIEVNKEAIPYFTSILNNNYFKRLWKMPAELEKDAVFFKINDAIFTYNDFGKYLVAGQRYYYNKSTKFDVLMDNQFNAFFEKSIFKYREDNLAKENQEYANVLKEYRDGLLLFDLLEKEVWNKAAKDTLGLEDFYKANASNYRWNDRVDIVLASSANKSSIKKARKLMAVGKTSEEISKALNSDDTQNIIFTKGILDVNDAKLPNDFEPQKGLSKIYKHNEAFHVIMVNDMLPAQNKTLDEAKGAVITDYQNQIEIDWLDGLREKFEVLVNQDVLNSIKAQIKN